EVDHLPGLGVEVTRPDLGSVLHLLDGSTGALATRFLRPLRSLVLVLPVVHDATYGWVGLVRHLDQVVILLAGDGQGLWQGLDPDLLTVSTHEADLAGTDAVVDAGLVSSYRRSLLVKIPCLLWFGTALRITRKRYLPGGDAPTRGNGRPKTSATPMRRQPEVTARCSTTRAHQRWSGGGRAPLARSVVAPM